MKIFISIFAALVAMAATAQTDTENVEIVRPVASAYTLEVGSSHITDTYLSPLKYNGLSAAVGYERSQAMKFCPEKWGMQLRRTAGMDYTDNPAKNVNIWGFGLASTWGMMRKFRNVWQEGLHIYAGGSTSLNLGALYSTRNGNNPVSAKASWTVNATAMAVYSLKIKSLPVTLRYHHTPPGLPRHSAFNRSSPHCLQHDHAQFPDRHSKRMGDTLATQENFRLRKSNLLYLLK